MRVNPPFHVISSPAEHPSQPFPKDFLSPNLLFRSSACIDRAVVGGFLPPPRNDTQPDPPNDTRTDPANDIQTDPPHARTVPRSDKRNLLPDPLSFPHLPSPQNFYRDHPTNAFSSARIHLFRFIVVKFRSLLSHERPVCTLRCRRLLHFPRPSSEARGFFLPVPAKTSLRVRPCVRSARCRRTFSSPILPIPDPPGLVSPKHPERPTFLRNHPRHPRLRPRPTSPAQRSTPFTPSPRPTPPRPTIPLRRRPATPPRTGLRARFAPRRSRSGLSTGKA